VSEYESPEKRKQRLLDLDRDLQIAQDRRELQEARQRVESQRLYEQVCENFGFTQPQHHEPESYEIEPSDPASLYERVRKRMFPNAGPDGLT
jgi:hypothetical protein